MQKVIKLIKQVRAIIMRSVKPASGYWLAEKSLKPLSTKFGYDRGKPIDRFWIENFLDKNRKYIKGTCLEITDNTYTRMYGGDRVEKSDILDINEKNTNATILGDLRNLGEEIPENTYDCIILTHVLGLIDDVEKALSECRRILKPGGAVLATTSCFSPTYDLTTNYWRFTPNGAKYLFKKYFDESGLEVYSYGNILAGQCFWVGMSREELTEEQLKFNDPKYPCIVCIKAVKEGGKE